MPIQWSAQGTVTSEPDNPSAIPNIWEWWEPSREGLSDGAQITTLNGQFAGKDWTKGVATTAPTYDTDAPLNGLGVAVCTGDLYWASGPDMTELSGMDCFAILKADTDPLGDTVSGLWSLGNVLLSSHYPFSDGVIYESAFTSVRKTVGNPALSLASWRCYEVISTGSEFTVLLDNAQIFTTATNSPAFVAAPKLGRNFIGNSWNGRIAGLYFFSAKLTGGDKTTMIDYINTRFALGI